MSVTKTIQTEKDDNPKEKRFSTYVPTRFQMPNGDDVLFLEDQYGCIYTGFSSHFSAKPDIGYVYDNADNSAKWTGVSAKGFLDAHEEILMGEALPGTMQEELESRERYGGRSGLMGCLWLEEHIGYMLPEARERRNTPPAQFEEDGKRVTKDAIDEVFYDVCGRADGDYKTYKGMDFLDDVMGILPEREKDINSMLDDCLRQMEGSPNKQVMLENMTKNLRFGNSWLTQGIETRLARACHDAHYPNTSNYDVPRKAMKDLLFGNTYDRDLNEQEKCIAKKLGKMKPAELRQLVIDEAWKRDNTTDDSPFISPSARP